MQYNKYIDHTELKADATVLQITKLCKEAKEHQFASVCVNGYWVPTCKELLAGSNVSICAVVGFPLGATNSKVKALETQIAIENGANEIDMVINIGELKSKHDEVILHDIQGVVKAAQGNCVKVILETCLLSKEEIERACNISMEAKATFVKTSTGFSSRGATIEDVKWMKECVKNNCFIKAAGGVRTFADMVNMIEAGADRIGTSAGVQLLEQEGHQQGD